MRMPPLVALLTAALAWSLPAAADVVGDVHDLALRTARAAGAAGSAPYTLTLVDLAMFDAANAIERRYQPYRAQNAPPGGADPNGAALGAGCAAITALHPSQQAATSAACETIAAGLQAVAATTVRSWKRVSEFDYEIANARVWGGIHYRNSTVADIAPGSAVGRWVVMTQLRPLPVTW